MVQGRLSLFADRAVNVPVMDSPPGNHATVKAMPALVA